MKNHFEPDDTDECGDEQTPHQPEKPKTRRFGCLLPVIGLLMILYAGTVMPGMKNAGRLLFYIHLLILIGGLILLGSGLITGLWSLLKSRK